jgi:hypothetical protein
LQTSYGVDLYNSLLEAHPEGYALSRQDTGQQGRENLGRNNQHVATQRLRGDYTGIETRGPAGSKKAGVPAFFLRLVSRGANRHI